jgi:hypothetical protein
MRLQELFETTEDDRYISGLATKISSYLSSEYSDMSPEDIPSDVGTVGKIAGVDDALLSDVNIKLVPDEVLKKRARDEAAKQGEKIDPYKQKSTLGTWHAYTHGIELNTDFLGSNSIKSTIAHELRHALDDIKSGNWANSEGNRYTTPKKKEHRVAKDADDKTPYLAEPAEINARFMEVQHALADYIPRIYKRFKPEEIKQKVIQYIKRLLEEYKIAYLFPEKTESRDYKQLIKRIMAFASEEMKSAEAVTKKTATGNW